MIKTQPPKISDPINKDRYGPKFQALTDGLYQNNFSVSLLTEKFLKDEMPKVGFFFDSDRPTTVFLII